jgi:ATP/maltotriose-dependent transcriptional regulator MalT
MAPLAAPQPGDALRQLATGSTRLVVPRRRPRSPRLRRQVGPMTASDRAGPKTLSALLRELARCPDPEPGSAWDDVLAARAVVAGRFELVRELGRGGFGVVWEAIDHNLGRAVAFKAVRVGGTRSDQEERLVREGEIAARLSHPNVVTLYDVGRAEQGPYLVFELLSGETLAARLARGPVPVGDALRIAVEAAKGLAHAHEHGVSHRDLKPANVFLCASGVVKVLDLGMAHAFGRRRVDGGTPAYMAPEQVTGAPEDERTDVFALGLMMFEMLSGRRPFRSARALASAAPAAALEIPGHPALCELVASLLSKDPVHRPRCGADVVAALERLGDVVTPTPSARTRRMRPPASRGPSLAKLTRPRLHGASSRERLFDVLDTARERCVLWIAGPPGAGKTTLASTWLDARGHPGIWYQLDAGDSDVATFFYYLRRAAEAAGVATGSALPLLTPEYLHDVRGFARRWFRELFSRLPPGSVLALDNYQELATDSALHGALAAACDELPAGARLLVTSWVEPPPEFARSAALEQLVRVDPAALRLTVEEAQQIASEGGGITPAQARELHAHCEGWAAGFTLLRERARLPGHGDTLRHGGTMRGVFDYFIAQVFREIRPEDRTILVQTSLFPRFTERMAIELTGTARVGEVLEHLYERHLFVDRRYGREVTYQYHALFRAFLREQAERSLVGAGAGDLACRAATLLDSAGMPDEAVDLLIQAGDHGRAAGRLAALAPLLVASGRGVALRDRVERLSGAEQDRSPWLSYWVGAGVTRVSLRQARSAYERAYSGFVRDGDRTGQAMAAIGVLHTHFLEMDGLELVGPWLPTLESLFAHEPDFPSEDVAAATYGTLVGLMLWALPAHPLLPACIDRLERLLRKPLGLDAKVTAASHLVEYYGIAGFVHEAHRVAIEIEALVRDPRVSALARASWLMRSAWREFFAGDHETLRRKLAEALAIATEHDFPFLLTLIHGMEADVALDLGQLEVVPSIIERNRAAVPRARPVAVARWHWIAARLAALHGDLDAALRECEACFERGSPLARLVYQLTLASILTERGELDRARGVVESVRSLFPAKLFPNQQFWCDAADAILATSAEERERSRRRLGESLRRVRTLGVEVLLGTQPLAARQLARLALTEDIETAHVQAWIRRVRLRPPSLSVPNWPWSVRVLTLGEFGVEVDGARLGFRRKTPRKPLELLQALVALGPGAVSAEALGDALWPDSEADHASAALTMTLSRLRKLLGYGEAVVLRDGKLSLDARLCWVDAWAFQRLCSDLETHPRPDHRARLLDLYRGDFLENERDRAWALAARRRLRQRFVSATATLGVDTARQHRDPSRPE